MAIYINLVCSKGGVGKTTITAILACMVHAYGQRIALVDHDPAANLLRWWEMLAHHNSQRPPYTVIKGDRSDPKAQLATLGRDHDVVIADCAGAEDPIFDTLAASVDISLVPFTLGQQDVLHLLQMRSAFTHLAASTGQSLLWLAVLNRMSQIDTRHPAYLKLPDFAREHQIPLAGTVLWQRRAFQRLTGDALTIDPANAAAHANADALFREIIARISDHRQSATQGQQT